MNIVGKFIIKEFKIKEEDIVESSTTKSVYIKTKIGRIRISDHFTFRTNSDLYITSFKNDLTKYNLFITKTASNFLFNFTELKYFLKNYAMLYALENQTMTEFQKLSDKLVKVNKELTKQTGKLNSIKNQTSEFKKAIEEDDIDFYRSLENKKDNFKFLGDFINHDMWWLKNVKDYKEQIKILINEYETIADSILWFKDKCLLKKFRVNGIKANKSLIECHILDVSHKDEILNIFNK